MGEKKNNLRRLLVFGVVFAGLEGLRKVFPEMQSGLKGYQEEIVKLAVGVLMALLLPSTSKPEVTTHLDKPPESNPELWKNEGDPVTRSEYKVPLSEYLRLSQWASQALDSQRQLKYVLNFLDRRQKLLRTCLYAALTFALVSCIITIRVSPQESSAFTHLRYLSAAFGGIAFFYGVLVHFAIPSATDFGGARIIGIACLFANTTSSLISIPYMAGEMWQRSVSLNPLFNSPVQVLTLVLVIRLLFLPIICFLLSYIGCAISRLAYNPNKKEMELEAIKPQ